MVDVRTQAARGLFLVYHALSSILVRFPLWTLIGSVPALRPRRRWTLKRVFMTRLIEYLIHLRGRLGSSTLRTPDHRSLALGGHSMGIWIEPVPHLVVGQIKEWASSAGISAIRIPGYWHNKAGSNIAPNTSASPDEKIILKFHGGAYVAGSAIPDDPTANTVKGVLERATSVQRAFSVEYRLSVGPPFKPANGFPAALIDALAGYNHLVNVLSFQPENIIIEGDSAGGNLALALTMYLIGNRDTLADAALPGTKSLTSPGGLILCSPWADIGSSHDRPLQSYLARSDYVGNVRGSRSKYSNKAFLGSLGLPAADTNMYISPASKIITNISFAGWPRTLISCGGAEYLAPSIRTLKERMAVDMGEGSGAGQVSYCEVPDGIHDFLVFTWHEPERSQVLKIMADWVDK